MLTYIQLNAAKPSEKAWTLTDSRGVDLVIQPDGSKLWRLKARGEGCRVTPPLPIRICISRRCSSFIPGSMSKIPLRGPG
jgi:hypothetical protein